MSPLEVTLLCVLLVAAGYAGTRWLFAKDTEIEERRRAAAKLAGTLSNLGLRKTPEFLVDYSVGDYSGMTKKIADLARLFNDGEDAVVAEFSQVFDNVLKAKLKDEAGRALIAAKLADAVQAADPSVVQAAPLPSVTPANVAK